MISSTLNMTIQRASLDLSIMPGDTLGEGDISDMLLGEVDTESVSPWSLVTECHNIDNLNRLCLKWVVTSNSILRLSIMTLFLIMLPGL